MIYGEGPYADVLRYFIGDGHSHAWIAEQTKTHHGEPLTEQARQFVELVCDEQSPGTLVIISTQLPVGTCAYLEERYPRLTFAVQPENVRVATARDDFQHQSRAVVGCRHDRLVMTFERLFSPFTDRLLFMTPESAEMTKHALNTFLALNMQFGNELGALCETWGADPLEVVQALRTDPRISGQAPILPGDGLSPHLQREVHQMISLGAGPIIRSLV